MNSKWLFWLIGGSAAFALAVALRISAAQDLSPQPKPAARLKANEADAHASKIAPQRRKRTAIPLQRDLELVSRTNNEFRNPPELVAENGRYELCLAKDRFSFPGASLQGAGIPQFFELLTYKNKDRTAVGPTIRVRPGNKFKIHVKNDLTKGRLDAGPSAGDPPTYETPHGLCTTNLHTHGLHVSPAGDADNVFRLIQPGDDFTFEYDLRDDHPSGTFWYHPHKHGSVAYQLSNGLAGALIVEREKKKEKNKPGDVIRYLDDIYEIAQAEEKVMVLQLYNYRVGDDGDARIDASTLYNVPPDSKGCEAVTVTGPDPAPNSAPRATAINGIIVPTIQMVPGEVQRWRIVHASWDELQSLVFADQGNGKTDDILFREVAADGLATGGMDVPDQNTLELAPGQRSDVLIQAPTDPTGKGRVYYLKQQSLNKQNSLRGVASDALFLAKIVVAADPKRDPKIFSLPDKKLVEKCKAYPADLPAPDSDPPPEFKDGILFNGVDLNKTYNINYLTFHNQNIVQIKLGTTQEWTIKAAPPIHDNSNPNPETNYYANNHPFHIHVNPFQVIKKTDANGKSTPMNLWRDTLLVHGGESYTIRIQFRDFTGGTVLHCHILDHEDQGMMVPLNIYDPTKPQPTSQNAPGANLKPESTPAPVLKLREAGGVERELGEFRGRNVVLVFFQGMECIHCAGKLRDLVREARGVIGGDAEIVAVSSRPVENPARALKALGVSSADKFHLLVDEGFRAFRDFGCYDGGPLHGLFLIDRDGVIRARYTGELPFDNAPEAVRQVRALAARGEKKPPP